MIDLSARLLFCAEVSRTRSSTLPFVWRRNTNTCTSYACIAGGSTFELHSAQVSLQCRDTVVSPLNVPEAQAILATRFWPWLWCHSLCLKRGDLLENSAKIGSRSNRCLQQQTQRLAGLWPNCKQMAGLVRQEHTALLHEQHCGLCCCHKCAVLCCPVFCPTCFAPMCCAGVCTADASIHPT